MVEFRTTSWVAIVSCTCTSRRKRLSLDLDQIVRETERGAYIWGGSGSGGSVMESTLRIAYILSILEILSFKRSVH